MCKIFLIAAALVTTTIAHAQTHIVLLNNGYSILGTPELGNSEDEIVVLFSDRSKSVIKVGDIKEIKPFDGTYTSFSITEGGEIPPPRDWHLGFLLGTQMLGSSTYQISSQGSSSSDSSNPGFGYSTSIGYQPESKSYGATLSFSSFGYVYRSNAESDRMNALLLSPSYWVRLNQKLKLGAAVGLGLIWLKLGTTSIVSSGAQISLPESSSTFGFSPKIMAEYSLSDRFDLTAEAAFTSFSSTLSGTITTLGSPSAVEETIKRTWFTVSAGLSYRFTL